MISDNLKKVFIDYNQFGIKLVQLYKKILKDGVPTHIFGIANGGLNLSKPLANWFRVKHSTISIHFYNNYIAGDKPYFADIPIIPKNWNNLLLVDDILDSGATINYFIEKTDLVHGVNFKIATMHWNPKGKYNIKPDYYIDKKLSNSWIIYNWEPEAVDYF